MRVGGLIGTALTVVVGLLAVVRAARRGPASILESVGARPAGPGHEVLDNVVTELAIAADIAKPAIYVIEAGAPNAFAVGLDPNAARSSSRAGSWSCSIARNSRAAWWRTRSPICAISTRATDWS